VIFLSQNLCLQAQRVQKWRPPKAEIQKLQQQKIGLICKFPGFLQDVFFVFLLQLAAISERFEPEGPDWAYFPHLFKLSLFFLYSIGFGPNLCKI
jgi:hypothetical protein